MKHARIFTTGYRILPVCLLITALSACHTETIEPREAVPSDVERVPIEAYLGRFVMSQDDCRESDYTVTISRADEVPNGLLITNLAALGVTTIQAVAEEYGFMIYPQRIVMNGSLTEIAGFGSRRNGYLELFYTYGDVWIENECNARGIKI